MNKAQILKYLRTFHSWLGLVIMPWVVAVGFTGFYLNHSQLVTGWISGTKFDEATLSALPDAGPVDVDHARTIAADLLGVAAPKGKLVTYHGFQSFEFSEGDTRAIIARDTGHYYLRTPYSRTIYGPDGSKLDRSYSWGRIFKEIHTTGWLDSPVGRLIADIVAVSLMAFGLTGLALFLMPRMRKIKRALGLAA